MRVSVCLFVAVFVCKHIASSRFLRQALMLNTSALVPHHTPEYTTSSSGSTPTSVTQAQGHQIRSSFFTSERVSSLLRLILHSFLCVTSQELRAWDEDPETYNTAQQSLNKTDGIRPAAEDLLLCLLDTHEALVQQTLVEQLARLETALPPSMVGRIPVCARCRRGTSVPAHSQTSPHVTTSPDGSLWYCLACTAGLSPLSSEVLLVPHLVVLKDALYRALGLCQFTMYDKIDFASLLQRSLLPLLQIFNLGIPGGTSASCPSHPWAIKVLQRRGLWLISCWVSELSSKVKPGLYEAISKE